MRACVCESVCCLSEATHGSSHAARELLLSLSDDLVGASHAAGAVLEAGLLALGEVAGAEIGNAVSEAALHDAHHHVHRGHLGHIVVLVGTASSTERHIAYLMKFNIIFAAIIYISLFTAS